MRKKILSTFIKKDLFFYLNKNNLMKNLAMQLSNLPEVRRDESIIENLHRHKIADPYRWLEDPDSAETKKFVEDQNEYVSPLLQHDLKEPMTNKLKSLWDYPKYSCPFKRGFRYYYFLNSGLQNQSVLYVQDSIDGESRVFLDPNKLSEDGTIALKTTVFSEDGETLAYGLSKSGSDWMSIHFKKVSSGEDYTEVLEKVKFSNISWTHDNSGIFYSCYPDQVGKVDGSETSMAENQKIFYHKIDSPQSNDVMVVQFPDHPKWLVTAEVSFCGQYLIASASEGCCSTSLHFGTIPSSICEPIPLTTLVDNFENEYEYITNDGPICIFRTNKSAPNFHLVKIDFENPKTENWKILVKEHEKDVLDWAACVDSNKLILCYISDVKSILKIHHLDTGLELHNLPLEIGSIVGYSGKRKQTEMFYTFTSYLTPSDIYYIDFKLETIVPKIFRKTEIEGFDAKQFETHQVFYPSRDGTKIPMFLVHSKDTKLDGKNTALLYGYGGFNISLQPEFTISRIFFMNTFKAVIAIANIRGGGEYGEKWHKEGSLMKKQNGFDDFIAAAEYLIENKYSDNNNIIIQGGSNGGLLVAAVSNQRPDLFAASVANVGVLDMLRFHKFTIGHAWCSDYGNPDEKEAFEYILKYSPVHNVRPPKDGVQYPATLLLTADHDDRVVPLHSYKFIATLQHEISTLPWQKRPLAIRIDTKAGHGGGKPTAKVIEERIDIFCFLVNALNLKVHL